MTWYNPEKKKEKPVAGVTIKPGIKGDGIILKKGMKIEVSKKFERNLLESFYIANSSQREETTGLSKCYVFQVKRIIISRGDTFFGWNLGHTVYKSLGIKLNRLQRTATNLSKFQKLYNYITAV